MHVSNIPIDELKPFTRNPKKHPEKQLKFLQKSFKEFGWTNPILVAEDNMIVAGHGRWEAAKQAGFTEVPVIKLDMPYEKAVAYVVADNHLAELAETDTEQLAELLQEISQIEDFDIEATGFEMQDIDEMMDELHPKEIIEDEVPDVPEDPITQRGDVWELGRHRVMCGDSTLTEDVDKLMDGERADMVFTDPPYNVDYVGKTKDALVIQNDNFKSDEECGELLWYPAFVNMRAVCNDKCAYYMTMPQGGTHMMMMMMMMAKAGWQVKHELIWKKQSIVLNRADYNYQHEPILYGWNKTHEFYGKGNFKNTSVWEMNRPMRSAEHPTTKPIELVTETLLNSSLCDDRVIDLFCGSGTTLIACEQLDRTCYGMELDPHYCDVIIQRYVNLTSNTELKRNGEPYTWQVKEQ